jgi:hypothetical protein
MPSTLYRSLILVQNSGCNISRFTKVARTGIQYWINYHETTGN